MQKIEPSGHEPVGYRFASDLFADFDFESRWHWLVIGNLWALLPLGVAALVLWLPYQFYAVLGAPLALFADPGWSPLLLGVVIIPGSMLLHEALHALALIAQGYPARLSYVRGYLYATTNGFLTRRAYLLMVLTPISVMTLGGALLLLFLPVPVGQVVLIALLLNAAASIGDLAVAQRALRQPSDALFADRDGGIKIFLRTLDEQI
jgi:hypothetical protein